MPSKTPATSIRLPPGLRPVVKSYAEDNALSEHAAILRLIKIGLERDFKPVNTPSPEMSAKIGQLKSAPKPKARWSLSAAGVQVGPSPVRAMPKPTKGKK